MGPGIAMQIHTNVLNIYYITNNNLSKIEKEVETISAEFDALQRAVEQEDTVIDSAIVLLDQLVANRDDPAKLTALMNEVANKREQLAASVLAGTPAAAVEQSTPTPAPGSLPGMTTGNNEGGGGTANAGAPASEPAPGPASEPATGAVPPTTDVPATPPNAPSEPGFPPTNP